MFKLKSQNGFTLIELSIVMLIVGLLLVGLLAPLSTQIEQEERQTTLADLQQIKEALYGFTMVNGRLPCPDCQGADAAAGCTNEGNVPDDGLEDLVAATCAATGSYGNVPWKNLGIVQFDSWVRQYGYAVDSTFADRIDGTGCGTTVTAGISFELCSGASLAIRDKGLACPAGAPGGNSVATEIPAVIFSQGKKQNTEFPLSCYEQENMNSDVTYVTTGYSRHTGANPTDPTLNYYFDDILIWISPHILKNRMVVSGRLP